MRVFIASLGEIQKKSQEKFKINYEKIDYHKTVDLQCLWLQELTVTEQAHGILTVDSQTQSHR